MKRAPHSGKKLLLMLSMCFISTVQYGQRKAAFIILDGICADVLETVETPAIDNLAAQGGYARAYTGGEKGGYSQSPTVSAAGYNHLLTGTWSNKHNVTDNDIREPNYNYWNIFRIVKRAQPDRRIAIFSSWTDNRTKLIGEGLPGAGGIRLDYSFDGFELDNQHFPHDTARGFMFDIDEHVSREAARYIVEKGPDLSWIYLEFTDDMGHLHGDGPEYEDAVRKADRQVGRIWNAIKDREATSGENWMLVVTTDHGRSPSDGKSHGGQSDRERTIWIATNADGLNGQFHEMPAVVDIMPSILRFMEIPLPESQREEIDGVPFIGDVSFTNLRAKLNGSQLDLTWTALNPEGQADVFISTTNNFRGGKKDVYLPLGKIELKSGHHAFDVRPYSSPFFKILVKADHNWQNVWVEAK